MESRETSSLVSTHDIRVANVSKLKAVHIMLTLGDYHAALQLLAGIEEMSGAAAIFARLVSNMKLLNSHSGF